jgi:hypothetical protein
VARRQQTQGLVSINSLTVQAEWQVLLSCMSTASCSSTPGLLGAAELQDLTEKLAQHFVAEHAVGMDMC